MRQSSNSPNHSIILIKKKAPFRKTIRFPEWSRKLFYYDRLLDHSDINLHYC